MNWEKVRQEYESSDITLKALAEKHDIKIGTLKSRKSREKWTKEDATNKRKVATIENENISDKQSLFCLYYLKYFNATKAYQKAYGCSYNTAMVEGHKSLRKPKLSAEIDRLKAEQAHELKLDARMVLQKYIDIAFTDISDYLTFGKKQVVVDFEEDEEGNKKPITQAMNYVDFNESTDVDGTLITEVKQGKDGVSIKLADKMKALDKLWEYFEILPESTKEKLQQEKLKADIAKANAETDKISSTDDDQPIEIRISRAGERNGN